MSNKKETIKIMIDVYDTDCGDRMYRVCDGNDYNTSADCCSGAGWYINEYSIDNDIESWKKDYNIVITKDYR